MNTTMRLIIGSAITLFAGSMQGQAARPKAVQRPATQHTQVAPELSRERAYFYLLKRLGVDDRCIDEYGVTFDRFRYQNSKDEFERNRYRTSVRNVLEKGVASVDFAAKFSVVGSAVLGEYDFGSRRFPITSWSFDIKQYFDGEGGAQRFFKIATRDAVNLGDFNAAVAMDPQPASAFVKERKQSNGGVNRTVYLRTTFSVLDRSLPNASNNEFMFGSYVYSIDVYDDNLLTRRLARLLPARDYADKVHGIEQLNTEKKIYYKGRYRAYWGSNGASLGKFGVLPSADGAEFYRVITYADGKIVSVKDYYITGELEMEGQYGPFCADQDCANGLFTWYHKNGYKRQEETFVNGKEQPYCNRHFVNQFAVMWDEDGKCLSTECPCTDQTSRGQ